MNKTQTRRLLYLMVLLSATIFFQCASSKAPIYLDENYSSKAIDEIVVLPVLDLRVEQEREIEIIDDWVRRGLKGHLKYKKYNITFIEDRSAIKNLAKFTEEEINEADPFWIKKLGPQKANWVLLPVLLDLSSRLTFGSAANAEMSAALYDKSLGKCIWRDKGIGKAGQGGLIGMAMKATNEGQAVLNACFDCIKSIPKNSKKPNKSQNEDYWTL